MARKLRTGFELPFANTGANGSKTFTQSEYYAYLFGGFTLDGYIAYSAGVTDLNFSSLSSASAVTYTVKNATDARTLSNGTRGCYIDQNNVSQSVHMIDAADFTSGFFANFWHRCFTWDTNRIYHLFGLYDGTNSYSCYIKNTGSNLELYIRQGNTTTTLNSGSFSLTSGLTWYNCQVGIDNGGIITFTYNGNTISHTIAGTPAFSTFQNVGIGYGTNNGHQIDDIAINDGSGASDNSTPNSIRGYNFFDAATLNTNSGFSAVGGTTVLANLQDGSDSTRASASADLSYIDFSLPTLSGTGMSETAANFTKIEAINVYGRQIEATKTSSLLKAKVTDTVAVVDREENLSLPLTVGNDSVTMFDDGSSDWVLANLDSGDMDFRVTFDKP